MRQNDRILEYCNSKGSITQLEAAHLNPAILRISERIRELEAEGYIFEHRQEKHNSGYHIRYVLRESARGTPRIDPNEKKVAKGSEAGQGDLKRLTEVQVEKEKKTLVINGRTLRFRKSLGEVEQEHEREKLEWGRGRVSSFFGAVKFTF